jgi:hypothetical protein
VQENRYLVREVRARGQYNSAVLLPLALENISYQYDRFIDDPLCRHALNLSWDAHGSATHALTVSYARRLTETDTPPFTDVDEQQWWRDAHDAAQQAFYLNETRSRFIDLSDDAQQWRLGLPWQQRSNALVLPKGSLPEGLTAQQVSYEDMVAHQDSAHWDEQRVLTTQSVQRYVKSDGTPHDDGKADFVALVGPLELAQLDKTALDAYDVLPAPFNIRDELAKIGYTPMRLLFEIDPAIDAEQNLWSVHYGYADYADLSQGATLAEYDAYHLAITRVQLPDHCTTHIEYDYHALQPLRIIDANENIEEALYEPSGQPLATSFHGTERGVAAGFRPLSEYQRPEDHRPDPAIEDPEGAVQKAASTLRKDLFSWMGEVPPDAALLTDWIARRYVLPSGHIRASARQQLTRRTVLTASELALREVIDNAHREPVHSVVLSADRYPDDEIPAQIQIIKACVDGFGRALQSQQLVDPGKAYAVDANGSLIVEDGQFVEVDANPRWRISERVEYNNKGLPVRQFRPFFANSHGYVNDQSLRELGYFDQLFYDPLGRSIQLINARGDFSRESYHPWYNASEDFNDTAEPSPPARSPRS